MNANSRRLVLHGLGRQPEGREELHYTTLEVVVLNGQPRARAPKPQTVLSGTGDWLPVRGWGWGLGLQSRAGVWDWRGLGPRSVGRRRHRDLGPFLKPGTDGRLFSIYGIFRISTRASVGGHVGCSPFLRLRVSASLADSLDVWGVYVVCCVRSFLFARPARRASRG